MRCEHFEHKLEHLVEEALRPDEASACEEHAAHCAACGDLLELARWGLGSEEAGSPDAGFVTQVLARTSGACSQVEGSLSAWVDGRSQSTEHDLARAHLRGCSECAALVAVLRALDRELPTMAEIAPEGPFVAEVVSRTLPVGTQLRRWWHRTWPTWVRRPRFASETAFIGLLVCVLVFATPKSPLEAVPRRALTVAQQGPSWALEEPAARVEERLSRAAHSIKRSSAARQLENWRAAGVEAGTQRVERAQAWVDEAGAEFEADWGTFLSGVASLLERADEEAPTETKDTPEERS